MKIKWNKRARECMIMQWCVIIINPVLANYWVHAGAYCCALAQSLVVLYWFHATWGRTGETWLWGEVVWAELLPEKFSNTRIRATFILDLYICILRPWYFWPVGRLGFWWAGSEGHLHVFFCLFPPFPRIFWKPGVSHFIMSNRKFPLVLLTY